MNFVPKILRRRVTKLNEIFGSANKVKFDKLYKDNQLYVAKTCMQLLYLCHCIEMIDLLNSILKLAPCKTWFSFIAK